MGGNRSASAILAAAGSGERLGAGGPKALVELGGRPLVAWSAAALASAESVTALVVAAPAGREAAVADAVVPALPGSVAVDVVAGGASRSESVALALDRVAGELVVVHDAARPLVEPALVEATLARLEGVPGAAGAIAAAPLDDTVKLAEGARGNGPDGGPADPALRIERTLERERLWAAQTPQAFRVGALRKALAAARDGLSSATDDASLVEAAGGTVLLEPAFRGNLKVTTAEDLRLAELLLGARRRRGSPPRVG